MKLAIIGPTAPWRGGIAHYTTRLVRALGEDGHHVTLLNFRRLYPDLLFPGSRQTDQSGAAFEVPNERVLAPLDPMSWVRTFRRTLESDADRLILQWWHPFFAPSYRAIATAASLSGLDVVFQCHNVEPHESTVFDEVLLRIAYGAADMFLVQSEPERSRLAARIGNDAPIRVVPHPPYDQFEGDGMGASDWREALEIKQEEVLLFFGLVRPYKGLDVLLEATEKLSKERDIVLVVAGEHYGNRAAYEEQILRLGIGDRVRMHDAYVPNEDVAGLFELADVCALPYRHATGSGVANIAVAQSVRVVMSDLPDLRDAFGDDHHWFPPGNAARLAEALDEALRAGRPAAGESRNGWSDVVDALTAPI